MDLHNYDFLQEEDDFSIGKIALPDELPKPAERSNIPQDLLKTSTVENLISQNEDLMGRLKVALRRLSTLEIENQKLAESSRKAVLSQTAMKDQFMILKEKDQAWKNRCDILETEKQILLEKSRAFEDKLGQTKAQVERYQKYHEKVKTQVKPYIAQLKEFTRSLQEKSHKNEATIQQQTANIADLRNQIIEITKISRQQLEIETKRTQDLTSFYENQIDSLKKELELLKELRQDYDFKSMKLNKALERQDWLENEVIQISRSKDDLKNRLEEQMHELQNRAQELARQNQRLGIEHADLQVRVMDDAEELQKAKTENENLREQLESIRYMWTAKNEENEKLKIAIVSLEKLNIELSQKINNLRDQDNFL